MFKEVPIARSLRVAFGGLAGVAFLASPAFGQTSLPSDTVQQGERVEVTGSSIKRIDAETALPVQVLTRQDIDRLAPQNVEDLLKSISATSNFGATQLSTGSFATTSGNSSVSLRGLGAKRTLLLVNGLRASTFGGVPGGGGGGSVDVNSIPLAAIERIEILKDGASAVYGSDAIAGVINFILRNDYVGGEFNAGYGQSTHSATGRAYDANVLVGFGDLSKDRFNVLLNAAYNKEDAIYGRDRYYANHSIVPELGDDGSSGNTFPANVVIGSGATRNPGAPANGGRFGVASCAPGTFRPAGALGGTLTNCEYDPASEVALIPQSTRTSLLLRGQFAITPDITAYGDASATRNIEHFIIQGTPVSDQFVLTSTNSYIPAQTAFLNANRAGLTAAYGANFFNSLFGKTTFLILPSSPFYPTAFAAANGLAGLPLDLRYRTEASGGRHIRDENTASRYTGGVKGTVAGWDWDASVLYSQDKVKESLIDGYPQYSLLLPLLNSGVINPFGDSGPAGDAALKAANYHGNAFSSKTELEEADLKVSRELFNLPAGPLQIAVGGDVRREKYIFTASQAAATGDLSGYGGNFLPISAARNSEAAFAEVNVPIIKGLEADAAVRYDKYNGVANTVNPKASLRWQPMKEFLLRSSIGTGFRAPNLDELFAPVVNGVSANGLSDPLRCNKVINGTLNTSSLDCATQFPIVTGGNAGLKPEKSVSASAGFQLEPTDNTHIGADYFDTKIRNQILIGGLSPATILGDLGQFGSLVTRGPNETDGTPGRIVNISQQNTNFGNVHVKGIDWDARVRIPLGAYGKLTVGANGTYFIGYDFQNLDKSYTGGLANADSTGGAIQRWRHIATALWEYGPYNLSFTQNYSSGYADFVSNLTGAPRDVGAYETFDVQTQYTGVKNLTLTLGMKNIMDRDPPFSNIGVNGQFQAGYDASYADVRGRFIYGRISYKFF
jgi:iron complex outermembrane receptor protein